MNILSNLIQNQTVQTGKDKEQGMFCGLTLPTPLVSQPELVQDF